MKAVVTEICGNTAVLLSDDGYIVKVKNRNYELGQEMKLNMKTKLTTKRIATTAAAACFVLAIAGGASAYYIPTAYVSLDVNPSIEYGVNMFHKVVSVKGVNDDGTEIVNEINLDNLKNENINDAISLTVDQIAKENYLNTEGSGEEAGIEITTSEQDMDQADDLAEELEEAANQACEENDCNNVEVNAEAVGRQRVLEAQKLGVTPGKLNLVEKLQASAADPTSIDINEWLNKPVKDIMAQTKLNREQAKNAVTQDQNSDTSEVTTEATPESTTGPASSNGNGNGIGNNNSVNANVNATNGNTNGNGNSSNTNASSKTSTNGSSNANTNSNGGGNAKSSGKGNS